MAYQSISGFTADVWPGRHLVEIAVELLPKKDGLRSRQLVTHTFQIPDLCDDPSVSGDVLYVMGDGQDAGDSCEDFLGNGVAVLISTSARQARVRTGLTGLPPVFVYADVSRTIVATSIERIANLIRPRLEFDPRGLVELTEIGHPIMYRTLFRNISLVPAGMGLKIDAGNGVRTTEAWTPPFESLFTNQREYVVAQEEALNAALSRMDLSHSFLSLTAGLDTRAIFALLDLSKRRVPAITISAARESVDARRAVELCAAYSVGHRLVQIDERFFQKFAEYAETASLRSGGLAAFSQASEVFFYKELNDKYVARLSGNLGNQVGRTGTEGVGVPGVGPEILEPSFRDIVPRTADRHWHESLGGTGSRVSPLDLIQKENLFSSLANSCIGVSYMMQQTPYADRTVIVQKLREPRSRSYRHGSKSMLRMKDLWHRFIGPSTSVSFQRSLVVKAGGEASRIPVNWGWRPTGGISIWASTLGVMAFADMAIDACLPPAGIASHAYRRFGLNGLAGFQYVDLLRHRTVAEFVVDTLMATPARTSSVIDQRALRRALSKGVSDRVARATLLLALDIVLAQQNFLAARGTASPTE